VLAGGPPTVASRTFSANSPPVSNLYSYATGEKKPA